mgnify:FL=1
MVARPEKLRFYCLAPDVFFRPEAIYSHLQRY